MTEPDREAVPSAALYLGFSGLIPFIALALAVWVLPDFVAQTAPLLIGYGVAILSFMGGCRWGFAAAGLGEGPTVAPLAISVLPALYAWVAAQFQPDAAMWLLAAGFMGLLAADLALVRQGGAPQWWPKLRWPLSLGAAGSMIVGALGV